MAAKQRIHLHIHRQFYMMASDGPIEPGSLGEKRLDLAGAILEYLFQIAGHSQPVDQTAEQSERQGILDGIDDGSAAILSGEPMRVTPKPVWPLGLDVDKFVGWSPAFDFREPLQWNAPDAEGIGDGGARLHLNGRGSNNAETHPGRREPFQVFGAREKLEDPRQGMRDP